MKKTYKMATIGQLNRQTRKYTYIERRVYEDESGNEYVCINRSFFEIDRLRKLGDTVSIWF